MCHPDSGLCFESASAAPDLLVIDKQVKQTRPAPAWRRVHASRVHRPRRSPQMRREVSRSASIQGMEGDAAEP